MRVHELAKELGVTSKELLETLGAMGVTGKSASSSVPEDIVPRLRASGGKATTTPAKPREVLEPPPAAAQARSPSRSRQGQAGAGRREAPAAERAGRGRRRAAAAAAAEARSRAGAPVDRSPPEPDRARCCR